MHFDIGQTYFVDPRTWYNQASIAWNIVLLQSEIDTSPQVINYIHA